LLGPLTRKSNLETSMKEIWCSKTTELPSMTLGASSDPIGLVFTSSNLFGLEKQSSLWIWISWSCLKGDLGKKLENEKFEIKKNKAHKVENPKGRLWQKLECKKRE